jgi:PAS domain S-box-containing protein
MNDANHDAAPWLAALVDSSDNAIISKDLDGVIRTWNTGAQRLFGFTPEEAVDQPITIIVPPELRGEENQILGRLRDGERIDHFETNRLTKNGSRTSRSLSLR